MIGQDCSRCGKAGKCRGEDGVCVWVKPWPLGDGVRDFEQLEGEGEAGCCRIEREDAWVVKKKI